MKRPVLTVEYAVRKRSAEKDLGLKDRNLTDVPGTARLWQEAPCIKRMPARTSGASTPAGNPVGRLAEHMVTGLYGHQHKNRSGVNPKQEESTEPTEKALTDSLLSEYAAKSVIAAGRKKETAEPVSVTARFPEHTAEAVGSALGSAAESTLAYTHDRPEPASGSVFVSERRMRSAGSENHSRNEGIYRKYGIRNNCDTHGAVRKKGPEADRFLAAGDMDFLREPQVCSVEERQRIWNEKQAAKENCGGGHPPDSRKKKGYAGYVRLAMVRDFILLEGMQEEGQKASLSQFIGRMAKYDANRLLRFIGGKMLKLLGCIAAAVLPVLLLAASIILPAVLLLGFLMHPVSFFIVDYDSGETLAENPKYIKNAVQEMYLDFHGSISAFADADENNQVAYAHGNIPNTEAVLAVYLSRLYKRADYEDLTEGGDTLQPYLLVDTDTEERLLKQVFGEFNYMEVQEIIIQAEDDAAEAAEGKQEGNGTREDYKQPEGEETPKETKAEKMTVYCLSLGQWKAVSGSSLSAGEQELLALLEEHAGSHAGGSGAYIPITDIAIPEGADQNVIYMAAFIKAEAGNQSLKGQVAVAYVILNRSGGPSGDIIGALTAPYQFSCYIPFHTVEKYIEEYASMTEEQKASDSCYLAAAGAYTGAHQNPIEDIKYYCNPKACSAGERKQWARIRAKNGQDDIIVIGDHVFCRYCW